jgi:sec-independent protein translocase protein TatC
MAEKSMPFLQHLEELRWHLIRSILAIAIAGGIAFLAKDFIFDTILFGPKKQDFPTYKWLCSAANALGFDDGFCFDELPFRVQSRTVAGQFSAHVWTSITAGFIFAFPYVIYQLWLFVSPGLLSKERTKARGFIFISSLLFFIGVSFGYYVVTPMSLRFLGTYSVSAEVFNDFDLGSYTSLVRASVLSAGFIFELPILVYLLTKIGLITPMFMRKYRKISLVLVLTLSAIITPPDIASQIVVAIPIMILYEVSIFISKVVYKNNQKSFEDTPSKT